MTDVAGFAASIYMRGLPFGFVSTTPLGQVDASVGGKNGVNVDGYKNMAGTFTQPRFVVCDPARCGQPEREFRAGLAEAVKAAVIADAELFARLERLGFDALRGDTAELSAVVSAAVRAFEAEIVERDEYEAGGPAQAQPRTYAGARHREALGRHEPRRGRGRGRRSRPMRAVRLGVLAPADRDRIRGLLARLGFDLTPPVPVTRLLQEVGKTRRARRVLRVVFPTGIGGREVRPMTRDGFAALFA